jgi:hypothetical protein
MREKAEALGGGQTDMLKRPSHVSGFGFQVSAIGSVQVLLFGFRMIFGICYRQSCSLDPNSQTRNPKPETLFVLILRLYISTQQRRD